MKILTASLLASAACIAFVGPASAVPSQHYETVCSTNDTAYDPPSGVYVAPDGTRWAGYKPDGGVPNSLVGHSSSETCVQVLVDDTEPT